MSMNLLEVLLKMSIYYGSSTGKTLWEEKFTDEGKFTLGEFTAVNMKNGGRRNVRKYRDIKDIDKYITLYILLKFGNMEKMIIKSSEKKGK